MCVCVACARTGLHKKTKNSWRTIAMGKFTKNIQHLSISIPNALPMFWMQKKLVYFRVLFFLLFHFCCFFFLFFFFFFKCSRMCWMMRVCAMHVHEPSTVSYIEMIRAHSHVYNWTINSTCNAQHNTAVVSSMVFHFLYFFFFVCFYFCIYIYTLLSVRFAVCDEIWKCDDYDIYIGVFFTWLPPCIYSEFSFVQWMHAKW